jgi:hypothetical protein
MSHSLGDRASGAMLFHFQTPTTVV